MSESIENKLLKEIWIKEFRIKFKETILRGNQHSLMAYMRVGEKKNEEEMLSGKSLK